MHNIDDMFKKPADEEPLEKIDSDIPERMEPRFEIMGFTEYDLIDFAEGFATGVYNKDVKDEYEMCIVGVPTYGMEIYNITQTVNIEDFKKISDIMSNIEEVEEVFNLVMEMVTDAPEEFEACEGLVEDSKNTFNWIMHHLSPTQMMGNLLGNLTTHLFLVGTDSWGLVTAFTARDFFKFGKDLGALIFLLIN